jgi:hypothetical protein
LTKGTSLKREADKSSRSDPVLAAVIATHAILYFISAFSCDDSSRKIRGKLALHENWKTTCEFIVWVINLVRDTKETELEGLWYILIGLAELIKQSSIACDMYTTTIREPAAIFTQFAQELGRQTSS